MFLVFILTFLAIFMGFSTFFSSMVGCFKKKKSPSIKNQQQQQKLKSKEPIQQQQQSGDGGDGPTNIANIYVDGGDPRSGKTLADGGWDGSSGFHDDQSKRQQVTKSADKKKPTEIKKKSAESVKPSRKKQSTEAIGGNGSHDSGPGDKNHSKEGIGMKSKEKAPKKNDDREEKAKKGLIVRRQADYPAMNDDDISDFDGDSTKKEVSYKQQSIKQQSQRNQKKVVGKSKRKHADDDKSHK